MSDNVSRRRTGNAAITKHTRDQLTFPSALPNHTPDKTLLQQKKVSCYNATKISIVIFTETTPCKSRNGGSANCTKYKFGVWCYKVDQIIKNKN